jgi:hypothetical protein
VREYQCVGFYACSPRRRGLRLENFLRFCFAVKIKERVGRDHEKQLKNLRRSLRHYDAGYVQQDD